MPSNEFLPVNTLHAADGEYHVHCPHCGRLMTLEGDDSSDIRGEDYQDSCGGWVTVARDAKVRRLRA